MFKLNPSPTFKAQVPLSVPGLAKPLEITVEFRHKGQTALKAWLDRAPGRGDAEILDEVIVGWSGVQGEGGEPVAYSLTALSTLLENYGTAKGEMLAAYLAELTRAKAKN